MREREQGKDRREEVADETKNDKEASVIEVQSGSGLIILRGASCVRAKKASEGDQGA